MPTLSRLVTLAFLFACTAADATPPAAEARGEIRLRNAQFPVVDGIAFADGELVRIALASAPIDREAMRRDGSLSTVDLEFQPLNILFIDLGRDGPDTCMVVQLQDNGSASLDALCDDTLARALSISRDGDGRVDGSAAWTDEHGRAIRVDFRLPLEQP